MSAAKTPRRWNPQALILGTAAFILISVTRWSCAVLGDNPGAVAQRVVRTVYHEQVSFPGPPQVSEEAPRHGYPTYRVTGPFKDERAKQTGDYSVVMYRIDQAEVNRFHPNQGGRHWAVAHCRINGDQNGLAFSQLW
jgi:hypothetical protein